MRNTHRILSRYRFSIIVPVLHESNRINSLIEHLYTLEGDQHYEIIVADGSATKDTINAIKDENVISITAPKGRAIQMNTGASIAKGEILIFLHADTTLPSNALLRIGEILRNKQYVGGAFDLKIDSASMFLRYMSFTANIRSRFTRIPYGDQVLFMRKEYFHRIGGFKEIPLMEDVELMKRIKKRGGAVYILKEKVITSARKWEREGFIRTWLKNHLIRFLYFLGVDTNTLAKLYYRN
jgi:rSAM/selenodomain-associated transferase 2